jgi:hypothetical protein
MVWSPSGPYGYPNGPDGPDGSVVAMGRRLNPRTLRLALDPISTCVSISSMILAAVSRMTERVIRGVGR